MRKKLFVLLAASMLLVGCSLFREDCSTCNGTGKTISFLGVSVECRDCNGKGYK